MGKKRIVKTGATENTEKAVKKTAGSSAVASSATEKTTSAEKTADAAGTTGTTASSTGSSKKRYDFGILHVQSTYNNTKVLLTDGTGNTLAASSSGTLGFSGAKKGTPFAAAKVGEVVGAKAQILGIKEVAVVVKGVGSGRESAIRGFISKSIAVSSIKDATPVPFNGTKPKKPRRV